MHLLGEERAVDRDIPVRDRAVVVHEEDPSALAVRSHWAGAPSVLVLVAEVGRWDPLARPLGLQKDLRSPSGRRFLAPGPSPIVHGLRETRERDLRCLRDLGQPCWDPVRSSVVLGSHSDPSSGPFRATVGRRDREEDSLDQDHREQAHIRHREADSHLLGQHRRAEVSWDPDPLCLLALVVPLYSVRLVHWARGRNNLAAAGSRDWEVLLFRSSCRCCIVRRTPDHSRLRFHSHIRHIHSRIRLGTDRTAAAAVVEAGAASCTAEALQALAGTVAAAAVFVVPVPRHTDAHLLPHRTGRCKP